MIKEKRNANAKEINWDALNGVLQSRPTLKMCADYLGCSDTHIENEIRRVHNVTFSEYRDAKMAFVKVKLVQQAIQMAVKGNATMLIFCLKNLCGWMDKPHELDTQKSILNIEDIVTRLNQQKEMNGNRNNQNEESDEATTTDQDN
jgi:hypothetical protein